MTQPNVIVFSTADVGRVPALDENNVFPGTNTFNVLNGTSGTINTLWTCGTILGTSGTIPTLFTCGTIIGTSGTVPTGFTAGTIIGTSGTIQTQLTCGTVYGTSGTVANGLTIGTIIGTSGTIINGFDCGTIDSDAYKITGTAGINGTIVVQDLGTVTHTMIFIGGILTSYATS